MVYIIHHLQNSRSFRVVWLLNELNLPYEIKTYPRINNKAPPEYKALHPQGKAPILEDGDLMIVESGNIVEYLLEKSGRSAAQAERMWCFYSEGTLLLHALSITYARWSLGSDGDAGSEAALKKCETFMAKNVQNDLDYVESQLAEQAKRAGGADKEIFLVGQELSVADVMMAFSVEFAIKKDLGIEGRTWPTINRWLASLEKRPAYIKARREAPHEL